MIVIVHSSRRPIADEQNVALDELFGRADVVRRFIARLLPATERLINTGTPGPQ